MLFLERPRHPKRKEAANGQREGARGGRAGGGAQERGTKAQHPPRLTGHGGGSEQAQLPVFQVFFSGLTASGFRRCCSITASYPPWSS